MGKMLQTIRDNFKRKHLIQLILLTVLFVIGARVVYTNEILPRMTDAYTQNAVETNEDTTIYPLSEGEVISQEFIYPKDQMIAIGVEIYSDTSDNEGLLKLTVYDDSIGTVLGEDTLDASSVLNMTKNQEDAEDIAYLNVNMGGLLSGYEGQRLRAELTVEKLGEDTRLYVYANPYKAESGYEQAVVSGAEVPAISMIVRAYCYQYGYWKWFYRLGCVLLFAMMIVSYFGIFLLKWKLHSVFLVAGTVFAISYTFLLPPVTVPDELNHMATAYYYTNAVLGIDEPEPEVDKDGNLIDQIYVRQTDLEAIGQLQTTPSLKEYDYIQWNILRSPSEEGLELVTLGKGKESDNWTLYLPGIIGILIGRVIGLNGITTIYLGRFFAVLLYLAVFYFAIKKVPVGKAAVFIFAICPMVLQQCCSYSYDAVPIALSVLFLAELFSVLYQDRRMEKKDAVLLAVLVFFIASCKGGVYIPECLLVLLIPKDKYCRGKAEKYIKWILLAAICLGFLINTLPYLLEVLGITEAERATQQYSQSLQCYTVSEVLTNPIHSGYVVINTFLMYIDYYLEGMYAGPLGWLNIAVNPFFAYTLLALMFLGVTVVQREEVLITKKQKYWIAAAWILTLAMSVASMMVSWTTSGNTTVSGLQGRYFTPVFLFLLYLFRGRFINIKRNIDKELAFVGISVNVIIINNILSSIQNVM